MNDDHDSLHTYTIRPLTEADLPALAAYTQELEAREPLHQGTSLAELEEWYHSPKGRCTDLLAYQASAEAGAGPIVGHAGFEIEEGDDQVWGEMSVHPDHRTQGIGRALLAMTEAAAQEWGAASIHLVFDRGATLLIAFLTRHGYTLERYLWKMQLAADHPVPPPSLPEGITLRTFVPGQDEELFRHVWNTTFAEHYGAVAHPLEHILYRTQHANFRAEGLLFAFDGTEPAGFCYTVINPDEIERRGLRVGLIDKLGVMPGYRGRGLGRALLLAGVNYLRQFVDVVELGVEGQNAGALALYESTGFRIESGRVNMLKLLAPAAGDAGTP